MRIAILTLCLLVLTAQLSAVEVASVFSDQMILQRDKPVPVWGSGQVGEEISVEFATQKVTTTVGEDGKWQVQLANLTADSQPAALTVTGDNTITFNNVVVGDIWLCAGQSNMQYALRSITGGKEFIEAADNPLLRICQIPLTWARTPQEKANIRWRIADSDTIGSFSAVGYLTGKAIFEQTKVPVGLINISWGGCRIESMTAREVFTAIDLSENVQGEVAKQFADLDAKQDEDLRKDKQRLPSVLFNAMVHPLTPFAVRGMLWYQGEDNHTESMRYAEKLRALAYTWRTYFNYPTMPIYIVQLPPWQYGQENPHHIPNFWTAQQYFAENDQNAGFIVTTDCGDPADIHPRDKAPLAARLANLVLYHNYKIGDDSALSPTFRNLTVNDNELIIEFNHANGLKTRDNQPVSHLTVAGDDNNFVAANGVIKDDKLIVSAPEVANPKHVRFGWDKLANPNLVNRAGVPVAPFNK